MNIRKVLEFIDQEVYNKTGQHLNDLQQGIIEQTLKRKKYSEMADIYGYTEGHVKDVGYELWKLLSDIFGESVHKGNLGSVLQHQENFSILNFEDRNMVGCINIYPENSPESSSLELGANSRLSSMINKLRNLGLTDTQIESVLELKLDELEID